jgi:hypothetical protein
MLDIISRIPSYSNEAMWKQCEILKSIVMDTKEIKIKRGKKLEILKSPKYKTDKETLDRIVNSCEYYKNLYEMEGKKVKEVLVQGKIQFRDYQADIIKKGSQILDKHGFLYLAMEVRTGKTLTSLGIAELIKSWKVLFITKKKAISTIEADYNMLNPAYFLTVINYESLHLVMDKEHWDLIICDEAHSMGAFPKPSGRAILVSKVIKKYRPKVILLSGTPTPESYSQMYHQVYAIPNNPFSEFRNFYRFCDRYVNVKEKKINGLLIKDYSGGQETIIKAMNPYTINYTQAEAGFKSKVEEEVLYVTMKDSTYNMIKRLKRDLVIEGKEETILADTPVKLMMKVHQLCSGTIKFESGNSMVLDNTKAQFVYDNFCTSKIGIFYKFKEELNALKDVFGDSLTTEISVFEDTDKSIALQIVSGREGISLRHAEFLVYYNIDFSATSYWQSKDRMTTKERLENKVYWIFAKDGIEQDIYKAVTKKKDYTINHFKKDFYETNSSRMVI